MKRVLEVHVQHELVRDQIVNVEIDIGEDEATASDQEVFDLYREAVDTLAEEEVRSDKWDESIKDSHVRLVVHKPTKLRSVT